MKLGLVADVHERVELLDDALRRLREERVDQIVVLGDVCDLFHEEDRIEETCRLLTDAGAIGVWGNHDFRFCIERDPGFLSEYPALAVEYMASLRPRLEIDGCFFSHIEPWLDAEHYPDLWYGGGPPETRQRLHLIFAAVANRVIFAGHYHVWLLATPEAVTGWKGEAKASLGRARHFVAVGALCNGDFGVFDTSTGELLPLCASAAR